MKLLLHLCCAPCGVAIVDKLKNENDIALEGFFYNPNIHPQEEYGKRKESVILLGNQSGVPISIKDENQQGLWAEKLSGNKLQRCKTCYAIRLDQTASMAKQQGFDAFTTSLLISPWQDHEMIIKTAEEAALKYDLHFYYEDFRHLYRQGQQLARANQWYMQKFCGCMYSYTESDHPKKPIYFTENNL